MQSEIQVRVYEELNDYLPPGKRKHTFGERLNEGATVEELLRLLGVPQSEVDLVLVNGDSVPLSRVLARDDRVSIYPVFESFDIRSIARLREKPLRSTRFMVGRDLGRLCAYLRALGFDVLEACGWTAAAVAQAAEREKRILLTRDPFFTCTPVSRLYVVKAEKPIRQLIEIIRRFDLDRESAEAAAKACRGSS